MPGTTDPRAGPVQDVPALTLLSVFRAVTSQTRTAAPGTEAASGAFSAQHASALTEDRTPLSGQGLPTRAGCSPCHAQPGRVALRPLLRRPKPLQKHLKLDMRPRSLKATVALDPKTSNPHWSRPMAPSALAGCARTAASRSGTASEALAARHVSLPAVGHTPRSGSSCAGYSPCRPPPGPIALGSQLRRAGVPSKPLAARYASLLAVGRTPLSSRGLPNELVAAHAAPRRCLRSWVSSRG